MDRKRVDPRREFGANLVWFRRKAGLTQTQLAERIGVNRTLELGQKAPRLDTILKLAAGTRVSPCVLLAGLQWRPGYYVYVGGE